MTLTGANLKRLDDIILHFTYAGDAIRLATKPTLLDDDFYNGAPWQVSYRNIEPDLQFKALIIGMSSLRKDVPVYLEDSRRLPFLTNGQVSKLLQVEAIPRYGLAVKTGGLCGALHYVRCLSHLFNFKPFTLTHVPLK